MSRSLSCIFLTILGGACNGDPTDQTDAPIVEEACTGFASTPQVWNLDKGFVYDYKMATRDGEGDYWNLIDLDGDGFLDLVETAHGSKAAGDDMGDAWFVWWGDGSRFSARARFALPFDHRTISGLSAANAVEQVMDIDGDGDPDLVLAWNPETRDVWDADGDRHWRVYLNEGRGGLAAEPVVWSLPDRIDYQVHSARSSGKAWTTLDMNGDGLVEIMHHRDINTGGNYGFADDDPHWLRFSNTGDGFAETGAAWPIPLSPTGYDGWYTSHTDGAYLSVSTLDLTGDGLPDLISPTDSAWPNPVWGAGGDPHWRVHVNTGEGFEREWIAWSVPQEGFDFPSSSADWIRESSRVWDTMSIGGGRPALVVASDPETGDGFVSAEGDPTWKVYRSTGEGFETEASDWAIPDPLFTTFWETGAGATHGWTTVDLTGDGCLDLVLTAGLDLGLPEAPDAPWRWHVYPGE